MAFPKKRKLLAALGMSTLLANDTGFPLSLDSAAAKRSKLVSNNSDILMSILLRSSNVVFDLEDMATEFRKYFSSIDLDNGSLETIENSASYLKQKSIDFKKAVAITIENRDIIVENLLRLTFLYVGIFVIQVLVLPLLIFWVLVRIVNSLFHTSTISSMIPTHNSNETHNG